MKKNIKLNNITITDVQYFYQLKDIVKEIKKFIIVDDSSLESFFDDYKIRLQKNELFLNIDVCACGSTKTIDQLFIFVEKNVIQKGRKKYILSEFLIRNETVNSQTLIRIRDISTHNEERGIAISKFRKDILPKLLIAPLENDNDKIIKDFYSIERSYQINMHINSYDNKINELLNTTVSATTAKDILSKIELLIGNKDTGYNEFNVYKNTIICHRDKYYLEMEIMLHSEWCFPTTNGSGDVAFEACSIFSDLTIGDHFNIASKSSLNNIAKHMNTLINKCETLSSTWNLIYDINSIRENNEDEYMISLEEIISKIDRQYYNISQIISEFYDNYCIILKAIEIEIMNNNLKKREN